MRLALLFVFSTLLTIHTFGQLENPYQQENGLGFYSLFDQQQAELNNHWLSSPSLLVHTSNCVTFAPSYQLNLPQAVSLRPSHQEFGQAVLMLGLNLLSRGGIAPTVYPGNQTYYPRTPD